jgi:hypothetical protein
VRDLLVHAKCLFVAARGCGVNWQNFGRARQDRAGLVVLSKAMKEQIIADLAGHGNALLAFLKVFIDFTHTHPLLMVASSALLIFASIRNDFSMRVDRREMAEALWLMGSVLAGGAGAWRKHKQNTAA